MGRPKGSKNKVTATNRALNSPAKINDSVEIGRIRKPVEEVRKYYCTCCGHGYTTQKGHFSATFSPLFAGNNGFVHICNSCRDKYFDKLTEFFSENEEKAFDRICGLFDWYCQDIAIAATRQISAGRSRVGAYPSKMCLPQTKDRGTTYLDTIRDRESTAISSMEELEKLKNEGKADISKASAERWGLGLFNDADYKVLDDHYKMLKKQNPNCDSNQEIFIKDLCYIKLQQMNAMRDKKPDDFKTFTQLYRETFKQAGLKTVQEADSSNDEVFGVTLATISQFTPEEYYKDKSLYKDFDGLGEYISRFITRPLKNLQFGSHERDTEFCVKDDSDEE